MRQESRSGLRIYKEENGDIKLTCKGGQTVKAIKNPKTWRADFDYSVCEKCPFKDQCNTIIAGIKSRRPTRYSTFYERTTLSHTRFNNIETLPESRKKLRANVEATVKEEKRGMKNNKLRIRSLLKVKYYLIWTSIAINLIRITRLCSSKMHFWATIALIITRK